MYLPSVPKEEVVLEMTGVTLLANFAAAQKHGVIAGLAAWRVRPPVLPAISGRHV